VSPKRETAATKGRDFLLITLKERLMKYTPEQREQDIAKINDKLVAIRDDRGIRYGSPEDTLHNVREADPEGSWRGAYVSAVECMNRLKNMFMTPDKDQDIHDFENATDDLINYAFYIKILGRQKRLSIPNPCEAGDCE
jgi:hypothetical protein